MNLSERKKKILSAVISENVSSGEPVSSKQLQEKHLSEYSSATIRNDLATLEELGLLYHPHTSSGRLPTADGIKLYVDEIVNSLQGKELKTFAVDFNATLDNIESELKTTARAISEATNYTSVMYIGIYDLAKIEKVGLMQIDESRVLAMILTDRGVLQDIINYASNEDDLRTLSKMLTQIFGGKTLKQIEESEFLITEEMQKYKLMFSLISEMVARKESSSMALAIEGKDKLFDYPEFSGAEKTKNAIKIFEEPTKLISVLMPNGEKGEIEIMTDNNSLSDCTIVTASYKAGGKTIGKAGVMGPMRMDYKNVIEVLKGMADAITEQLDKKERK